MRKIQTPFAPQTFSSGCVTFFHTEDTAAAGDIPRYAAVAFLRVPYEDKKVGDVRYYAALQADSRIDRVVRVPHIGEIDTAGDIAVVSGDARQYRVTKIARNSLTVPESWDVTLEISRKKYKLAEVVSNDP